MWVIVERAAVLKTGHAPFRRVTEPAVDATVSSRSPSRDVRHNPNKERDGMAIVESARPLRAPAVALGCSYLVAIVMLGPLLGSSADASTAFTEHFDDDGNRIRDLIGSLVLLVAAAMLVWTAVVARSQSTLVATSVRDLSLIACGVTASTLVVASALLMTVPLTSSIGELTDDPGIDTGVQAGIAQAGTVMLLVAALGLACAAVLLARLGRRIGAVPGWITATAWAAAVTLCLGVSVGLLVPFAAWVIALGLAWRTPVVEP
jgi:hypothetical protein